jgi:sterol desaturase/sphingolipid hydroxylase (fatty acid hydroxylase superfamily)
VTALGQLLDWLREVTPAEIKAYYWAAQEIYASPWFYLGIAAIFTLEWLRPAVREQRVFSPGLLQDFLWFNLDMVFKVAALPAFAGFLHLVYDRVTGGFVLPVLALLPTLVKVAISFVLFDFLQWFHHWVRHRVKALWQFHVIHHSQRELNLFTDLRVHFAEYLAAQVLTFVPMFMLGLSPFAIVGVGFVVSWYTRLIHANVRFNFGPLRHVLVSPQYHRIHHSIEPQHQDRNFGVILTVWDRAFGTLYPHYDEYPATGVHGVDFAPAAGLSPRSWARDLARQNLYPFRQLTRRPSQESGRTPPRFDAARRDASAHDDGPGRQSPLGGPGRTP